MKWSDSQRAQLLQIYKDKIIQLGEEEFFARFDEIREEAHRTIGVESEYEPHDNRPYAVNCTDGKGILQSHLAEGYIISPTGRRIGAMCRSCAQVVIEEYQTKLGQTWTFEPQDWRPVTQEQIRVGVEGRGLHQLAEMGTYIDPIHSSAATLGRLGGRARSEAKTTSSRSNGKKGGRPSVKQLDLEEI